MNVYENGSFLKNLRVCVCFLGMDRVITRLLKVAKVR